MALEFMHSRDCEHKNLELSSRVENRGVIITIYRCKDCDELIVKRVKEDGND